MLLCCSVCHFIDAVMEKKPGVGQMKAGWKGERRRCSSCILLGARHFTYIKVTAERCAEAGNFDFFHNHITAAYWQWCLRASQPAIFNFHKWRLAEKAFQEIDTKHSDIPLAILRMKSLTLFFIALRHHGSLSGILKRNDTISNGVPLLLRERENLKEGAGGSERKKRKRYGIQHLSLAALTVLCFQFRWCSGCEY